MLATFMKKSPTLKIAGVNWKLKCNVAYLKKIKLEKYIIIKIKMGLRANSI